MRQLCYTDRSVRSFADAPCCFSRPSSEQGPLPIYALNLTERFKNWRFFGENGLAGSEVSVWVYEGTLKIEYQTTALALYSIHFSPDQQQIAEVTHPRRLETPFRSPQLDLWQLSDTEWLLALRRPEPAVRKKQSKIIPWASQLPLPEFGATG